MNALFDLMDPEWLWTLIILVSGGFGAFIEWKRSGAELKALEVRVGILEQTTVRSEDWSDITARQMYLDRIVQKLVDEWSGEDEDTEPDS